MYLDTSVIYPVEYYMMCRAKVSVFPQVKAYSETKLVKVLTYSTPVSNL